MPVVFTQGSISTGESAGTEAEILYFLEAFYTREALLAMPEDLEVEEFKKYVKAIRGHIVSISISWPLYHCPFFASNCTLTSPQKLCSQSCERDDSRVPYILYALNRIQSSQCHTKSQLLLTLVLDDTLKSYVDSNNLLVSDLILPGNIEKCDMYWLETCKDDLFYLSIV